MLMDFSPRITSLKLPPFAVFDAFGNRSLAETRLDVIAVFSSTRLPGFSGRDLFTTTLSLNLDLLLANGYPFRTHEDFPG